MFFSNCTSFHHNHVSRHRNVFHVWDDHWHNGGGDTPVVQKLQTRVSSILQWTEALVETMDTNVFCWAMGGLRFAARVQTFCEMLTCTTESQRIESVPSIGLVDTRAAGPKELE